jgi:hypothetical protein
LSVLARFCDEKIQLVPNIINSGNVFRQWEKGLSFVKKDSLVWIAESDDSSAPCFLQTLLPTFDDPDVVIAYSRSFDINEKGEIIGLSYKELPWAEHSFVKAGKEEVVDHLYIQCTIPNVSAVIFKNSFVDRSFFENDFRLCGDWFFYAKLLQFGKIAYVSIPLNYHRFHQNTVRNKNLRSLEVFKERIHIVKEIVTMYYLDKKSIRTSINFQSDIFMRALPARILFTKTTKEFFVFMLDNGPGYTVSAFTSLLKYLFIKLLVGFQSIYK